MCSTQHCCSHRPFLLFLFECFHWAFCANSNTSKNRSNWQNKYLGLSLVQRALIFTLPFHLLVGGGTEEVHSSTRLRAALKHKGFSQGNIWSHLSPFQLYCWQSPSFAFILKWTLSNVKRTLFQILEYIMMMTASHPFVSVVIKAAVMCEDKPSLPPAFNQTRLGTLVKIATTCRSWGIRTTSNVWPNGHC